MAPARNLDTRRGDAYTRTPTVETVAGRLSLRGLPGTPPHRMSKWPNRSLKDW
jgi:hypothetical protein